MNGPIELQELCDAVGMAHELVGPRDRVVTHPAPIDTATADAVTFYSRSAEGAAERIGGSSAGVVICTPEAAATLEEACDRTLLLVANPRLAFIRVMNRFFAPPRPVGIHPTAVIHPEAKLGKDVYVGPFTYVGKAEIGDGTVIDGHTHIYDNVTVGGACRIQSHCVLGGSSLALERTDGGELECFPQMGGVRIGSGVELGRGAVVDRGTLGDTVVERGCRIDGGAVVAHNAHVAPHCVIGWGAIILGSVVVGSDCWISPGACVREGVHIGRKATVGMGAVVTKDVPEGATVYGVPAREAPRRL